MRIGVVLNEAAGGGRGGRRAAEVLPRIAGEVRVERTRGPGDGRRLARELGPRVDLVVSCGGDGTLYEVVNGLMDLEGPRPALGLLPLGTGNSFGRDFGIVDEGSALEAIGASREVAFDAVRVEHADGVLHYVNLLSVGFAAEVGALTNRRFKPLGALGYVASVLVQVGRLRATAFPYAVDGGPTRSQPVTLLSFSNTRYTGGEMMMAPAADPTDGMVDVISVGAMGRRRLLSCFPRLFRGTHVEMPEVEASRAGEVVFDDGPVLEVMLDGEIASLRLRRLQVVPGALRLRVPA